MPPHPDTLKTHGQVMLRVSDLGEKRLISDFLRPLFNPANEVGGVGDDCAMLDGAGGQVWLFSTDRVPADLTAFRLGIIGYSGLGTYLARLNISDLAGCGGRPLALLLNLGLPGDLPFEAFSELCTAFNAAAASCGCKVLGGDITSSDDLSVSATAIGVSESGRVLTRRGASPGDSIFASRPLGLTPAAFTYFLGERAAYGLSDSEVDLFAGQFTRLEPMVELGQKLAESGHCTSCMDNTDGVGQSLLELATASNTAFVVDAEAIQLPQLVAKVAARSGKPALRLAMSGGADFSLVGTLRGEVAPEEAKARFGDDFRIIGNVQHGAGVMMKTSAGIEPLDFVGWNYFKDRLARGL